MKSNQKQKGYNGHRSWNSWNVSLWLNNDEKLYKEIQALLNRYGTEKTIQLIAFKLEGLKTPDGAIYSKIAIKDAIKGMVE